MSVEAEGGVAARAALTAGEVVGGKYTIASVVGEGGMGIVYEARHDRLGQQVALKVLRHGDDVHHDEIVARFEREARAAARLKSSHVARVYDVDQLSDGTPYIVMEYLDGVDLAAELRVRGVLPVDEAVDYVLQACSAVAEAHSLGIIHRDLKPQNLFLVGEGSNRQIKLLDFGISKVLEEGAHSVTLTRSSLGTPLYMSPEQIRSSRSIDQRSDIWSLGVILYELVTGRPPFEGEGPTAVIAAITADSLVPPNERCPQIPRGLSEAIVKALEKDVTHRFQSVHELAEVITQYGPSGAWIEPLTGSSPSNPRISIHDAMTIRGDAATLLADSSNSNQPLALTPDPPPASRPRRGLWIGLGVGALVVLGALAALRLSSAPGPGSHQGATLAATEAPVAPTPAPPEVPDERPRIDVAPVAPSASPPSVAPTSTAKPKPKRPTPAAPTPAAPPPTAAPPPPPANNPLHL